jgi:hypothetical protein
MKKVCYFITSKIKFNLHSTKLPKRPLFTIKFDPKFVFRSFTYSDFRAAYLHIYDKDKLPDIYIQQRGLFTYNKKYAAGIITPNFIANFCGKKFCVIREFFAETQFCVENMYKR